MPPTLALVPKPASKPTNRVAPAEEKKLKLKSPNFIVSSTRLSVRNLPASWDEKKVKDLFVAAVSRA